MNVISDLYGKLEKLKPVPDEPQDFIDDEYNEKKVLSCDCDKNKSIKESNTYHERLYETKYYREMNILSSVEGTVEQELYEVHLKKMNLTDKQSLIEQFRKIDVVNLDIAETDKLSARLLMVVFIVVFILCAFAEWSTLVSYFEFSLSQTQEINGYSADTGSEEEVKSITPTMIKILGFLPIAISLLGLTAKKEPIKRHWIYILLLLWVSLFSYNFINITSEETIAELVSEDHEWITVVLGFFFPIIQLFLTCFIAMTASYHFMLRFLSLRIEQSYENQSWVILEKEIKKLFDDIKNLEAIRSDALGKKNEYASFLKAVLEGNKTSVDYYVSKWERFENHNKALEKQRDKLNNKLEDMEDIRHEYMKSEGEMKRRPGIDLKRIETIS